MILIVSIEKDTATIRTLYWLRHFKQDFIRINEADLVQVLNIEIDNSASDALLRMQTPAGQRVVHLSAIRSYWYRRGFLNLGYTTTGIAAIEWALKDEQDAIAEYLYDRRDAKHKINAFRDNYSNKLNCLQEAAKLGLRVPPTIVTSCKADLEQFYFRHQEHIITKPIYNIFCFTLGDTTFDINTKLFPYAQLKEQIPDAFFPTLFQAYIDKKYELRIFYLEGAFLCQCHLFTK